MPQDLPRRRLPLKSIRKEKTMGTLFALIFFAFVGLGCWFIVHQIRKAMRLQKLQLRDAEEREHERNKKVA
jgi:hypothetical protein